MFEIFKSKADIEPIVYIKEECVNEFLKGAITPNIERLDGSDIALSMSLSWMGYGNVSKFNLSKEILYQRKTLRGVTEVHFELNDRSEKGNVPIKTTKKYRVEKNDSISVKLVQYEVVTEIIEQEQ